MKLRKKIASALAFVMAFSTVAAFSVSADTVNRHPGTYAPATGEGLAWVTTLANHLGATGTTLTERPTATVEHFVTVPGTETGYVVSGEVRLAAAAVAAAVEAGSTHHYAGDFITVADGDTAPEGAIALTAFTAEPVEATLQLAAAVSDANVIVTIPAAATARTAPTAAQAVTFFNTGGAFVYTEGAEIVGPATPNPLPATSAANPTAFGLPAQGFGWLNATGPLAEVGRFPTGVLTNNGNEWLAATGNNTGANNRGAFHGGIDLIIPAAAIYQAGISGVEGSPELASITLTLNNGSWNFAARTPNNATPNGQPLWANADNQIPGRGYFDAPLTVPGTNVVMGSNGTSMSRTSATDNDWDIAFDLHVVSNTEIRIEFDARVVRRATNDVAQNFLQIPLVLTRPGAAPQMQVSFVTSNGTNINPVTITSPVAVTGLGTPNLPTVSGNTLVAGPLSTIGERRITIPAASVSADLLAPVRANDPVLAGFTVSLPTGLIFTTSTGSPLHATPYGAGHINEITSTAAANTSPVITIPQLTAVGAANIRVFGSHTGAAVALGLQTTFRNAEGNIVTETVTSTNVNQPGRIVTNANGVITNLANVDQNNQNYAFLSHNGSRINVITTGVDRNNPNLITTSGSLMINGLFVSQRNPLTPTWSPDGFPVTLGSTILNSATMGNFPDGASTFTFGNFGSFVPQNINLTVGTVTELIAGRTFVDEFVVTGTTDRGTITPMELVGRVATLTLRDTVGQQGGPIGAQSSPLGLAFDQFTFTLTDADGYVLPEARIVGARFGSSIGSTGRGFGQGNYHAWYLNDVRGTVRSINPSENVTQADQAHADATHAVHGAPLIQFANDGHSLSVGNLFDVNGAPIELVTNLYLSTAPGFDGDVYVTVTSQIGNFSETVRVATVASPITVTTEANVLARGFHSTPVSNIVITENWVGALEESQTLNVAIQQFVADTAAAGLLQINFWPITRANLTIDGDANAGNRLDVNLENSALIASSTIGMNIRSASYNTAATITLSDLAVSIGGSVPVGTYGLIVFGSAVQDNLALNLNGGVPTAQAAGGVWQANQPNFVRFGHEGFSFPNYIDLREVLHDGGARTISVNWTPSGVFAADGNVVGFTNNAGQSITSINVDPGTLFAPMRAIIEAMGGTIIPVAGGDGRIAQVITTLPGAPNAQVTWTIGSTAVTGGAVAAVPYAPFIAVDGANGGNPANNGTTYLPLRGLAYAHGLVLDAGTTANPAATLSFPN